jgi:hypothetical protein
MPIPVNPRRTWITAEGRELSFDEMETSHLRHCIAKIINPETRPGWRRDQLDALKLEVFKREMSTKTYNLVAATMREAKPTDDTYNAAAIVMWQRVVSELGLTFHRENPRFKFETWFKACGYDDAAGLLKDIA